jgi:cyclic lactone autoinducer peptide
MGREVIDLKSKIMKTISTFAMLLAVTSASAASWLLIEQPKTPDALK